MTRSLYVSSVESVVVAVPHPVVVMTGSQFVVHKDLVEKFEKLYEEQLLEWQAESICDDDQNLVLQIYNKNKDIFELFPSNEWFTLFSRHLNKND